MGKDPSASKARASKPARPPNRPPGASSTNRIVFLFLDGVGIGPPDPEKNPFLSARLPTLFELFGGHFPTLDHPRQASVSARAFPLDPLLGVEGLPQSGTGQTALLTGENAPELFGRHFGPWVPVRLRPILMEKNLLARAQVQGFSCLFANAYPSQYLHKAWTRRPSGPALAAHSAGLLNRHEDHLARGEAISSEIINSTWRTRLGLTDLPEISPGDAGRTLARLSSLAHLTFFAHYSTDLAGHEGRLESARTALERVDAFLSGLVPNLLPGTLLVLVSDHGNVEDVTRGHTLNPTLGMLVGGEVDDLGMDLSRITDVPEFVLDYLQGS